MRNHNVLTPTMSVLMCAAEMCAHGIRTSQLFRVGSGIGQETHQTYQYDTRGSEPALSVVCR